MSTKFGRLISIALLVSTVFASGSSVAAQAPKWFPVLAAANSANGEFLAVWQYQYTEPKDGTNPSVKKVTFRVCTRETFPQDRFDKPGTFWSGATAWEFTMDRLDSGGAPWLQLISNNGDYLVLVLGTSATRGDIGVLRIYRKDSYNGVLVATRQLRDLWPPDQAALADQPHVVDGEPLWFVGGGFEFSSDNRQLIYKTRWGNTVRVNLADGKVSKD